MKYTVDEKVCKDFDISTDSFLYLLSLYSNNPITNETFNDVNSKGLIITTSYEKGYPSDIKLNRSGIEFVNDVIIASNKKAPQRNYDNLVVAMQELFPKGRKCDSNGIPKWSWRGNKTDITKRLNNFFSIYGEYDDESILEATKNYVERMKGDPFMRTLQYFILAQNSEKSDLNDELEHLGEEDDIVLNKDNGELV